MAEFPRETLVIVVPQNGPDTAGEEKANRVEGIK